MKIVPGIKGYQENPGHFISASESISFKELHQCILDLVPTEPANVLDLGSGSGRDAFALAKLGHTVVAVEPVLEYIEFARRSHLSPNITWVQDSLPNLTSLSSPSHKFGFILCHAVWQHLDQSARLSALERISALLDETGLFALALRHGPKGLGGYCFPADAGRTIEDAAKFNLQIVRKLENQASAIPGKLSVVWTRLVFTKKPNNPNIYFTASKK